MKRKWALTNDGRLIRKKDFSTKSSLERIDEFCNDLNLSKNVVKKVNKFKSKFLKKIPMSASGVTPRTFVASLIYLSATLERERRSEKEVSDVCGCTPTSIRKGIKIVCKTLNI